MVICSQDAGSENMQSPRLMGEHVRCQLVMGTHVSLLVGLRSQVDTGCSAHCLCVRLVLKAGGLSGAGQRVACCFLGTPSFRDIGSDLNTTPLEVCPAPASSPTLAKASAQHLPPFLPYLWLA